MSPNPSGAAGSLAYDSVASTDPFLPYENAPNGKRTDGPDPVWLRALKSVLLALVFAFGMYCTVAIAAVLHAPEQAASIVETTGKALSGTFVPFAEILKIR